MNSVDRVKKICKDRKIPISKLERELGFSNGYISQLRKGVFPADRLVLIADYLRVSADFLMTGVDSDGLTEKDNRDIAKDMESIRTKLLNGADGPLSYDGEPIPEEDAELLFGFSTKAERSLFRLLIRISGIGPKIALSILSGISASILAQAVSQAEPGLLTRIPGVGKKTAERIVLELKGKIDTVVGSADSQTPTSGAKADIISALVSLGYSEREALQAVKGLAADVTVNDGIREALKALSK